MIDEPSVDDVAAAIAAHTGVTAHVQIANAPGSGELDLDCLLSALEDHGYRGWVSLLKLVARLSGRQE